MKIYRSVKVKLLRNITSKKNKLDSFTKFYKFVSYLFKDLHGGKMVIDGNIEGAFNKYKGKAHNDYVLRGSEVTFTDAVEQDEVVSFQFVIKSNKGTVSNLVSEVNKSTIELIAGVPFYLIDDKKAGDIIDSIITSASYLVKNTLFCSQLGDVKSSLLLTARQKLKSEVMEDMSALQKLAYLTNNLVCEYPTCNLLSVQSVAYSPRFIGKLAKNMDLLRDRIDSLGLVKLIHHINSWVTVSMLKLSMVHKKEVEEKESILFELIDIYVTRKKVYGLSLRNLYRAARMQVYYDHDMIDIDLGGGSWYKPKKVN